MSEQEFNKIFSENLRQYLQEYDISQAELARRLNVAPASAYNWANGVKTPRIQNVDAMCEIFHCLRKDLTEPHTDGYYIDKDTERIAQEVHDNPELRLVFDACRGLDPEDMIKAAKMIEAWKS